MRAITSGARQAGPDQLSDFRGGERDCDSDNNLAATGRRIPPRRHGNTEARSGDPRISIIRSGRKLPVIPKRSDYFI